MAALKPRTPSGLIAFNKMSIDSFMQGIQDARKAEGDISHFKVNPNRYRGLTPANEVRRDIGGIMYWMYRDCRLQDNWAMIHAQKLALEHNTSLYVVFNIMDCHKQYPTLRHFRFLVDGLLKLYKDCKDHEIPFVIINSGPKGLAKIVEDNRIGAVICDFSPLKHPLQQLKTLIEVLPEDVPLIQVDAHNIVPAWTASDKEERMARFLRTKINKQLDEYLTGFPALYKPRLLQIVPSLIVENEVRFRDIFNLYIPSYDVHEIEWGYGSGTDNGLKTLYDFMTKNLKYYGKTSNDPSEDNTSKLSPWLNFGQISAQRVALEVKSLSKTYPEQIESYLEELIVRRELTDNYCLFNRNYDNIKGAQKWARDTLELHAKDKRTWIYTRKQLEEGLTHDDIWNSAQKQAYEEGKIHGYLRMYWCKKILEWTESPEQAIEYALWLNDTFCLDGTDPNGYVGVMWSICGVHDQGWKERDIFGKIRYMVDYSLKRKFKMDKYCARYGRIISKSSKNSSTNAQGINIKNKLKVDEEGESSKKKLKVDAKDEAKKKLKVDTKDKTKKKLKVDAESGSSIKKLKVDAEGESSRKKVKSNKDIENSDRY